MPDDFRAAFEETIAPLLERIDAEKVPPSRIRPGDIRLEHNGETVLGVRLGDRSDPGISLLLDDLERELGLPLKGLGIQEKRDAVRLLEQRGAFEYRKSAETIAEALGVTRFTVYNYLNRLKGQSPEA